MTELYLLFDCFFKYFFGTEFPDTWDKAGKKKKKKKRTQTIGKSYAFHAKATPCSQIRAGVEVAGVNLGPV